MAESFWPQSVEGWVGFTLSMIGLVAVLVTALKVVVKDPLSTAINGVGGRVTALEESMQHRKAAEEGFQTRISRVEGDLRDSIRDRQGLHENIGRLTSNVENLAKLVSDSRLEGLSDLSEIRERLVRIETKVDVVGGIREAISGRKGGNDATR